MPVPSLNIVWRMRETRVLSREGGEVVALFNGANTGRMPSTHQQITNRLWAASHRIGQSELAKSGVSEQACLIESQCEDFADDRTIVLRALLFAAVAPGAPEDLAQITPLRKGHEWGQRGSR